MTNIFSNTIWGRQEVEVDQICEKLIIRHFHWDNPSFYLVGGKVAGTQNDLLFWKIGIS